MSAPENDPPAASSRPRYRPDLDVLRGIAILLVLFYHFDESLPGGFLGVDMFFVLSGYLITKSVWSQVTERRFRVGGFYSRRFRRLAPQAVCVLAATLAASYVFYTPADLRMVCQSALAGLCSVSNLCEWSVGGYFAPSDAARPLLHYWSLAVEEQFYFLFPLLIPLLATRSARSQVGILICLTVVSLAAFVAANTHHGGAAFFLPFFRAWQLLAGVSIAVTEEAGGWRVGRWLPRWTYFLAVAVLIVFATNSTLAHHHNTLVAIATVIASGCMIGAGLTLPGRLMRPLHLLRWIGEHSYGMYLWHWPLLMVLTYLSFDRPVAVLMAVYLSGTVCLALLSEYLIERPVRTQTLGFGTRKDFCMLTAAVGVAAFAVLGMRDGFAGRSPGRFAEGEGATHVSRRIEVEDATTIAERSLVSIGVPGRKPTFALIGDSHAMAVAAAIDDAARGAGVAGLAVARPGTCPLPGVYRRGSEYGDDGWSDAVWNRLTDQHPTIETIILVARWNMYVDGRPDGRTDSLILPRAPSDGRGRDPRSDARAALRQSLRMLVDTADRYDLQVVLVEQVPNVTVHPQRALFLNQRIGLVPSIPTEAYHLRRGRALRDAVAGADSERLRLLETTDLFIDRNGQVVLALHDRPLYVDADHLSDAGGALVAERLFTADLQQPVTLTR